MKISKIASTNGWSEKALEEFALKAGFNVMNSMTGHEISDKDVQDLISQYSRCANRQISAEERVLNQQELLERKKACASMLITSGFNFDGYTIKKYSGYISGDSAVEVDRETQSLFGTRYNKASDGLMAALTQIRREALQELKEAAYDLGCNAVIGVDFDYITLDPETASLGKTVYLPYIFGVTANGNAVVIERNEC